MHTVDFSASGAQDRVLIRGGAAFERPQALSTGALIFTLDRGAYAFVGRIDPGAQSIEWLVTGPDRLQAIAISPNGKQIAY